MAVKRITIDLDAYKILTVEKRGDESFSKVIKRLLRPSRTAKSLLAALPDFRLTDEALDHTEALVRDRSRSKSESPNTDE